jgi:hypothetical protein
LCKERQTRKKKIQLGQEWNTYLFSAVAATLVGVADKVSPVTLDTAAAATFEAKVT